MALVRPPLREVRSRIFDSTRWVAYQPRPDDIIIATFPKCGTTWMERIVGMLLAASAAPAPVARAVVRLSPARSGRAGKGDGRGDRRAQASEVAPAL